MLAIPPTCSFCSTDSPCALVCCPFRYVVLAPKGVEQATLLATTAADKKLGDLPSYAALLKKFTGKEVGSMLPLHFASLVLHYSPRSQKGTRGAFEWHMEHEKRRGFRLVEGMASCCRRHAGAPASQECNAIRGATPITSAAGRLLPRTSTFADALIPSARLAPEEREYGGDLAVQLLVCILSLFWDEPLALQVLWWKHVEQEYSEELAAQADVFGGEDGAKRRAGEAVVCSAQFSVPWRLGRGRRVWRGGGCQAASG